VQRVLRRPPIVQVQLRQAHGLARTTWLMAQVRRSGRPRRSFCGRPHRR
jgi:hypothetical protein